MHNGTLSNLYFEDTHFQRGVHRPYLGVFDLQRAASRVDVGSVEGCFGSLGALHRVKCDTEVKVSIVSSN